jgi:hypothetical protein
VTLEEKLNVWTFSFSHHKDAEGAEGLHDSHCTADIQLIEIYQYFPVTYRSFNITAAGLSIPNNNFTTRSSA